MKDFNKIAIAVPNINIAQPMKNAKLTLNMLEDLKEGCNYVLFPELSLTGYSCGDLFFQSQLLKDTSEAIKYIVDNNKYEGILMIGAPISVIGVLTNCAIIIKGNKILGVVPKYYLPNNYEFMEKRYFNTGFDVEEVLEIEMCGSKVPFGNLLFKNKFDSMIFGVEICEDMWAPISPSNYMSINGCEMVFNLSASPELVGKDTIRKNCVVDQSRKNVIGYAYASTGLGESTGECVFATHNIVAECGSVIEDSKRLEEGFIYSDIDLSKIRYERRNSSSLRSALFRHQNIYQTIDYNLKTEFSNFEDSFKKDCFALNNIDLETIMDLNTRGLNSRIKFLNINKVIIGLSGGLDSTYTLLVAVNAFDKLGIDRKNIICVTMPSFATSDRTYNNVGKLVDLYGVTLKNIDITKMSKDSLELIGHNGSTDVVYENTQARIRTSLLMNIANQERGIVLGTADLSEIALGFSTYNADNMSMYGINSGLPKTVIRQLIKYFASKDNKAKELLLDVLNTPVSPELVEGQNTEDIIGKYEINDFIMNRFLSCGDSFERLEQLVETIFGKDNKKYVKNFFNRFFASQFKRQTMPEGTKILNISLSSSYAFRLPSDIRMDIK